MIVIIKNKTSNEISELVKELKNKGHRLGIDFDFEFSPGRFDYQTSKEIPRQTKFTFYNSKLGILFALKWN